MEILNLGWNARTVAFDSGPVELAAESKPVLPLSSRQIRDPQIRQTTKSGLGRNEVGFKSSN